MNISIIFKKIIKLTSFIIIIVIIISIIIIIIIIIIIHIIIITIIVILQSLKIHFEFACVLIPMFGTLFRIVL